MIYDMIHLLTTIV